MRLCSAQEVGNKKRIGVIRISSKQHYNASLSHNLTTAYVTHCLKSHSLFECQVPIYQHCMFHWTMLLHQSDWSDTAVILLWIHDCHPSHIQKEGTHSQLSQLSLPSLGCERHWYCQGSRNSEERRKKGEKKKKKDKWYHMHVKKNYKKNLGYFNHISVISVACLLCMLTIWTEMKLRSFSLLLNYDRLTETLQISLVRFGPTPQPRHGQLSSLVAWFWNARGLV